MVKCSSIRRLSGGKTVKVDLEVFDEEIKEIVISGDFFLYPEEYIHTIESELRGRKISEVTKILNTFKDRVEVVGASIEEFAEAVSDAYNSCVSG
ncbi:MAG: lipoate protein ligase C-terminal domain-containing protein [Sulfolobales archaeon]